MRWRAAAILMIAASGVGGLWAQEPTTSPHDELARPCAECHQASGWKPAQISSRFDHGDFGFPLDGAHAAAPCLSCHQSLDFADVEQTCASCHRDIHQGELGTSCARCHTSRSFTDQAAMFRMHQLTRFTLEGPHAATNCRSCHNPASQGGLTWLNRPTTCEGCHLPDYRATTNPSHGDAGFSTTCTDCHTGVSWIGVQFDHSITAFPLAGAHLAATCADCHGDGIYRGHAQECIACHQVDYDQAMEPAHRSAGFPTDCTTCHTAGPVQWSGAHFDHDATQFPLTGAHLAVTCADCHADGVFQGKPTTCVSCHQSDYGGTTQPNHLASGFPTDCTQCHTTTQWLGATFDHDATAFGLTGAHLAVTCQDCHISGVFQGTPTLCISCHQPAFNQTTNPDHQASGFATDCTQCHTTTAFRGAHYDHSTTQFPLSGAHLAVTCADCHADGVYQGKLTTCVSCHQSAFDQTTNPSHQANGFPTDCTQCHTTTQWLGATFDHDATAFALTGAHLAVTCSDCHIANVFQGTPTLCISCHQPAFNQTTNPSHPASGFPTDCTQCHTTTQWLGATFDHNTTAFDLTGAHLAVTCQDCHISGVFQGTPTLCISCHQTQYNQAAQPPHQSLAFPTDCTQCHTTTAWPGANYDHSTTQFPLTGAHVAASCQDCHGDGVYAGKSKVCSSCHQSDYAGTVNPNHQTAGFPTTCQTCHTTVTWLGATFDHDGPWFPIYSGTHQNRWTSCTDCHTNSSNYTVFTCLTCHEHSQTKMDDKHKDESGYSYNSQACYSCHPQGRH